MTYTRLHNTSTNLYDVEWVVVTACIGVRVGVGGVFPSLREATIVEIKVTLLELSGKWKRSYDKSELSWVIDSTKSRQTNLRRRSSAYLTKLALLGILLDRVAHFVCGDLILLSANRSHKR